MDQQLIQDKKERFICLSTRSQYGVSKSGTTTILYHCKDDIRMALENLGYSKEECDKRVQEAIELMDIKELQDRPVQYLSYGQKKKLLLRECWPSNRRFLLLDEPTAGLDPKGRDQMAMIMKN